MAALPLRLEEHRSKQESQRLRDGVDLWVRVAPGRGCDQREIQRGNE